MGEMGWQLAGTTEPSPKAANIQTSGLHMCPERWHFMGFHGTPTCLDLSKPLKRLSAQPETLQTRGILSPGREAVDVDVEADTAITQGGGRSAHEAKALPGVPGIQEVGATGRAEIICNVVAFDATSNWLFSSSSERHIWTTGVAETLRSHKVHVKRQMRSRFA